MAEYGRTGSAADWMKENGVVSAPKRTAQAPRLRKQLIKTATFDFDSGPYTLDDFRDFVQQTADMPGNARVRPTYHDSQMDGETFKLVVTE